MALSSLLINLSAQRSYLDIDLSHTNPPEKKSFVGQIKGKMVATSFLSYETDQQQIDKHGLWSKWTAASSEVLISIITGSVVENRSKLIKE